MGLDMYLKKRTYIGAEYEHRNVEGKVEITIGGVPVKIDFKKISSIEESAGYWRKANHIHQWFVDNCQGGEDDCRDAYVSKEKLTELLDTCKELKEDNSLAEDLLPCQEGFFFGGTEYDEYYFKQIDYTIELIEGLLKEMEDGSFDIYYTSSW